MTRVQDFRAVTESDKVPVRVRSEDQIDVKIGAEATKTNQESDRQELSLRSAMSQAGMPSNIQRTIFGRSGTVRVSDEAAIELPSYVLQIPDGSPGAIPRDNNQATEQNKLSRSATTAANGEARDVPTYDRGVTELGSNTLEDIAALPKANKDKTDEEDEKNKLHDQGFSVFIALSGLAISIFVALRKGFSKNDNDDLLDVVLLFILFAQVLSLALVLSSKIAGIDIEFLRAMWFTILASAEVATGFTCYLLLNFWIFMAVASAVFVVIVLFLAVRIWKKMSSGKTCK